MDKEIVIVENEVSTVEMLRIHMLKDLTPSELGQFLIYVEDLYRLSLIFSTISRKLTSGLGSWRKVRRGEVKYLINKKYRNEIYENDDTMGLFGTLDTIYSPLRVVDINNWESIYSITEYFPHDFKLHLIKITYNSPCKIDLLGLGEIIKHIKDFILELIKLHNNRKFSNTREYREMEEVRKLKLENIERFLSISKAYNLEISELKRIMIEIEERQDFIVELIDNEKLDHIETVPFEKKIIP